MKEPGKLRNAAGRTASRRSGSSCDRESIGKAKEACLKAISEFGHNSAEALAARMFAGELIRRFGMRRDAATQ